MTATESPAHALARIQAGTFCRNDAIVIQAFSERGIPIDDIEPRDNVLTFRAWLAKGRHIRRGEKAVYLSTWIKTPDKTKADGTIEPGHSVRKAAFVFHISQTEPN